VSDHGLLALHLVWCALGQPADATHDCVETLTLNQRVLGSSPSASTTFP
jgi:hypothetical protein